MSSLSVWVFDPLWLENLLAVDDRDVELLNVLFEVSEDVFVAVPVSLPALVLVCVDVPVPVLFFVWVDELLEDPVSFELLLFEDVFVPELVFVLFDDWVLDPVVVLFSDEFSVPVLV